MYQPIAGTFVIGIGHKARQGKDVVAKQILQLDGAEKHSFADDLYAVARVMFGMTHKDGRLLQVLGTDVFRKKDPEVWVKSLYYKLLDRRPRIAIMADVRFPNEAAFVKSVGGMLVKVNRWNKDGSIYVTSDRDPNHPSETALDGYGGWDTVIDAEDGDLRGLRAEAGLLMDGILEMV